MKSLPQALLATLCFAAPALAQDNAGAARFIDLSGAEAGSVMLTQTATGVTISGTIAGLSAGQHGFHFHAVGACDAAGAFESAGDHFNPSEHQHGMENPDGPHAGDLPNLTAAEDGTAVVEVTTQLISLTEGDPAYVFDGDGTALVIHNDPDDMRTDPSGNSGDRIACAVVESATP